MTDVDQLADGLLNRADADQAELLGSDGLLTELTQLVPKHARRLAGFNEQLLSW
ncbi:hypothetical protein [Haloechinothrix alba]|uniref:hypothetical protein n=1 Tax=Haloechinothrix alba TaxID=664784 RepID=UPI0015960E22|nr:hypothetical protein [Haloechinothrix alba]